MASLIEELIETLEKEDNIYEELLPVVEKKAQIIIKSNTDKQVINVVCNKVILFSPNGFLR